MNIDYTIDLDGFGFVRSVTNYTSLRDHRLTHRDKLSLKVRFTRSGVAQDIGTLNNSETHFTLKKLNEENEVLSSDSTVTTWTKTTSGTDVYYTHDGVVDLDTVEIDTLLGQAASVQVDAQFTWKVGSTVYRSRLLKTAIDRALYPSTLPATLATDPSRSYVTMLQNVNQLDGDSLPATGRVTLESISTVGLQVPRWFSFVRAGNGSADGRLYYYQLRAGTDAESGTDIRRPDDYDATTNAKVFDYQVAAYSGGTVWGSISGTLSGQTDLQAALDLKATDADLDSHVANTSNPHSVTKAQVGLSNADNTSDANKPVSTATQTALDLKENTQTAASQAEMEAGTQAAIRSMSPLRIKQAIDALAVGGTATWGGITGTLSAQTDLATALGLRLLASNNLSDLGSAGTARTNLGLGTLATQNGTFSGTSSGTNTGDQTITLTGDVTGSGTGSFAATIANDAVTFAKMQEISGTHLVGRHASGTGNIQEVNVGNGLEFHGSGIRRSALTGDVTASAGSDTTTLATVNSNVGSYGSATAAPAVTVNAKGLVTAVTTNTITPAVSSITGLGTGIATALAINSGTAGAPVLLNGALGTPSSGVVTNLTGTASININGTVGATTPNTGAFTSIGINGATPSANSNFATTSSATNYLEVKTTSTGAQAAAGIFMENSTSNGYLYKAGTGYTTYKNIAANDLGFYNNNIGGNISILNDHTSGNISFAAGGSSTAHLTIASTGVVNVANLTTNGVVTATSGNGTLATVAPGSNGNVLTSNGTTWTSAAPAAAGATLSANTFTGLQQFSGTGHAGIRLNNLTTAERDALSSPAAGMAVWNTTDGRLQLHNGSAWTSGMVRLSGDTMTGALTITQGTANTGILASTGYSLTGSNATPMIDLAGTWNTTGTPTGIKLNITNTASNAASPLIDIQSGGTSRFRVLATGGTVLGGGASGPLSIVSSTGTVTFTATGDGSLLQDKSIVLPATGYVRFGFVGGNDPIITGASSSLTISQITSFQLGANTATASATAVGQTIKGPNATGTTSTGGSLTLAGGTGTSAGGAVIISTAATTTQTERARFSSAGVTIGASGTAIASVISATATLDFASTNAHECSSATITVTGAAVGDVVALGIPTAVVGTSGVFFGWVSAADTVTVRYHNTDKNNAVDPASGTFRATVIKH